MKFKLNDGGRSDYFKGNAGDCVVRALAILLKQDYKKIYDFAFRKTGCSPRDGVYHVQDVYSAQGLIYESISGYAGDYHFDEVDFDFIAQYQTHVHAVIGGEVNDTHQKYSIDTMDGLWFEKKNQEEVLKILYPNDYYEDEQVDEYGLTWVR